MRLLLCQQSWSGLVLAVDMTIKRCLCRALFLRVVCKRQRLDEGVPFALLLGDVVSQAHQYGFVILFY